MKRTAIGSCAVVLALLLAVPDLALACPYCYANAAEGPLTVGIAIAMGSLLAVTMVVGAGFFAFFRRMGRRARLLEAGSTIINEYGELVDLSE